MLDGKRYYAAFPEEKPEKQSRMQAPLYALERLQREFRQQIESLRGEAVPAKNNKSDN
jgi:hypothetical protein